MGHGPNWRGGVLPRFHGRLRQESESFILHVRPTLHVRVVKPLDVVERIVAGLGDAATVPSIHRLTFEHPEEPLGGDMGFRFSVGGNTVPVSGAFHVPALPAR